MSGECFTYLGRNYRLKIATGDSDDGVKLMNGRFYVYVPPDVTNPSLRVQLHRWSELLLEGLMLKIYSHKLQMVTI